MIWWLNCIETRVKQCLLSLVYLWWNCIVLVIKLNSINWCFPSCCFYFYMVLYVDLYYPCGNLFHYICICMRVKVIKYIRQVRVINSIEQGYDTHTHFLYCYWCLMLSCCILLFSLHSDSKSLRLSLSFLCVRTTFFCFL